METLTIPSPTAFLSSPVLKPAPEPPPPPKRKPTSTTRAAAPPKRPSGIVKPKQSKSRNGTFALCSVALSCSSQERPIYFRRLNTADPVSYIGCITCKAKRLKCDETKPSCQQCHKRNVTCGGYKKDFKWRPFEETTFNNKVVQPPRPKRSTSHTSDELIDLPDSSQIPYSSLKHRNLLLQRAHLPMDHRLRHPAQRLRQMCRCKTHSSTQQLRHLLQIRPQLQNQSQSQS